MIAVVGGLAAAAAWAAAALCTSRSARLLDPPSVLAWVMLVGLAVALGPAIAQGPPSGLDAATWTWLALAGAGNVGGLLLSYAALRIGKVGIVAPICSSGGAIGAAIAVLAGERLGTDATVLLGVVAAGVLLTGLTRGGSGELSVRSTVLAVCAALCFGLSFYGTGRVSASLPLAWAVLPARVVGVVAIALPLVLTRRLRLTRRALPLVVAAGLCEVAGFVGFALGARHGIAITAVLASQFAAIAAVAAYVVFGERLSPRQAAGVATIATGVAALAAVQA